MKDTAGPGRMRGGYTAGLAITPHDYWFYVRIGRDIPLDPIGIARGLRRAGDDEIAIRRQTRAGEIALVAAARIEDSDQRRPGRLFGRYGADLPERGTGFRPGDA